MKAGADEQAMFKKLGQAAADSSIGDLMGAGAGGAAAGGAAAGGAPAGAEGAGQAMGAGGQGEPDISPEELAQALQTLVQQGTISEQEASQVLDYVMAAEGGQGGEGGAPAPAGAEGAAAPAPEAAPAPAAGGSDGAEKPKEAKSEKKEDKKEDKKEASAPAPQPVDKAAALMDAIRQIKAANAKK